MIRSWKPPFPSGVQFVPEKSKLKLFTSWYDKTKWTNFQNREMNKAPTHTRAIGPLSVKGILFLNMELTISWTLIGTKLFNFLSHSTCNYCPLLPCLLGFLPTEISRNRYSSLFMQHSVLLLSLGWVCIGRYIHFPHRRFTLCRTLLVEVSSSASQMFHIWFNKGPCRMAHTSEEGVIKTNSSQKALPSLRLGLSWMENSGTSEITTLLFFSHSKNILFHFPFPILLFHFFKSVYIITRSCIVTLLGPLHSRLQLAPSICPIHVCLPTSDAARNMAAAAWTIYMLSINLTCAILQMWKNWTCVLLPRNYLHVEQNQPAKWPYSIWEFVEVSL